MNGCRRLKSTVTSALEVYMFITKKVALMFTEYDVARGILKFQCKTWEFRATSYSVNSQATISVFINRSGCLEHDVAWNSQVLH